MTAWSRERPTKAGWYWWQDQFWEPECVEVYEMNDVPGVLMVSSTNLDKATALDTWGGEWQGPLEPKE